jgi:fibronectin type 3 domain-containing protein
MTKHFLWLVAAVAAYSLTSCGAGTALTGAAGDLVNPAPAIGETGGLPNFPLETGPRTAAATGDSITLLGSDYIQKRNATDDGDALVIGPTTTNDGTAYGLYRFSGLSGMTPATLTVNAVPGELEQRYYVGLADFSELRWRWFGPVTIPEFQHNFEGDYNRYISALGNMYMVVVTHGANTTRHESSTLTFGPSDPGDPTNPGAPTNLHASDGTHAEKVMLEWNAGEGAEWYRVFRKAEENSAGTEWVFIGESQTTSFADLNVENDHVYYYKVNAARHGANGEILYSGFSNVDSGYCHSQGNPGGLDAPTGLVATDGHYADKVRVEWNAVTNAGWYRLYRLANPSGSDWVFLGESQTPSYNDYNVDAGHVYAYKVQAAAQGGGGIIHSDFSNVDTGYASGNGGGGGDLDAPTGLVATDGLYTDKVRVEWHPSTGAGWYRVFRAINNAGAPGWTFIGESQTNSYNDMQVEPTVVYNYKVQAAKMLEDGTIIYSDFSNDDTGYAGNNGGGGDGLDAPQNLVATDGTYSEKIRVEWGAVDGAEWYKLYRRVDGSANDFAFYAEAQTNSFDDFQVEPDHFFLYKVKAVGHDGNGNIIASDFSNSDSGFVGDDGGNPGQP